MGEREDEEDTDLWHRWWGQRLPSVAIETKKRRLQIWWRPPPSWCRGVVSCWLHIGSLSLFVNLRSLRNSLRASLNWTLPCNYMASWEGFSLVYCLALTLVAQVVRCYDFGLYRGTIHLCGEARTVYGGSRCLNSIWIYLLYLNSQIHLYEETLTFLWSLVLYIAYSCILASTLYTHPCCLTNCRES